MNALWERAERAGRLKSVFDVLKRELQDMQNTKLNEIAKFEAIRNNAEALRKYQTDSGLTYDVCNRILSEIKEDLSLCEEKLASYPLKNAIDGEKDLKSLYNTAQRIVWDPTRGSKPTDIIIIHLISARAFLGDCKFGLKSHEAWLFRNYDQFEREYEGKIIGVAALLKQEDNVIASDTMLMVVTSAMAPLLKNRLSDYQLEENITTIPYDRIEVCSVEDIAQHTQRFLDEV